MAKRFSILPIRVWDCGRTRPGWWPRSFRCSIQPEIHLNSDARRNRLSVLHRWVESVFPSRLGCLLIKIVSGRFLQADVSWNTIDSHKHAQNANAIEALQMHLSK